jgi:hypothetical protein
MQDAWEEIERLGRQLGAGEEAIRKWRIRGVPKSWRLDLIDADKDGKISRAAFDQPPGSRRSENKAA